MIVSGTISALRHDSYVAQSLVNASMWNPSAGLGEIYSAVEKGEFEENEKKNTP